MKTSKGIGFWGGLILLMVGALVVYGVFGSTLKIPSSPPSGGGSYAAALSVSGIDPIAGGLPNTNAELWSTGNTQASVLTPSAVVQQQVAETNVNAALTSLSTNLPNSFNGFVMMGNDNFNSGTFRGSTPYYYYYQPIGWSGQQGLVSQFTYGKAQNIPQYKISNITWTYLANGVANSTPNVTGGIGSGASVTTESVVIAVSGNGVYGNPQLDHPIALCANSTTAGKMKYIGPQNSFATMPIPLFAANAMNNFVGGQCEVLNTQALFYATSGQAQQITVPLTFQANSGVAPTAGDCSYLLTLDKNYYKDDNKQWQVGWGFNTVIPGGTSKDTGAADLQGNTLKVCLGV